MAIFHFTVTQTKRSKGQSAIASAAYRSGERLYSEYYGEYSDYTRKGGVICSDILLPSHAPKEYADRQTLWNAVEKAERGKTAQLAYSFEISLQNEFSLEENIALARKFLLEQFVSRGMTVDVSFHEKEHEDGGTPNPHFHFLCPIRPIEQDGTWGLKQRRVYALDEDGNRIRDQNGEFVFNAVPTTDWGSPETLEHWRQTWAEMCNAKFAEKGLTVRIDHRSYERQGVDLLPTIHEGATVRAMEKKGIRTEKGEFNRWIKATNAVIRDIPPHAATGDGTGIPRTTFTGNSHHHTAVRIITGNPDAILHIISQQALSVTAALQGHELRIPAAFHPSFTTESPQPVSVIRGQWVQPDTS